MDKLKAVAQDGMRVRASAGAGSFRREDKLKGYLEAARQRVEALRQQVDLGRRVVRTLRAVVRHTAVSSAV